MILTKQRLWTDEDYHHMAAAGMLTTGNLVELLEGKIIEIGPRLRPLSASLSLQ
jgi:hypothetical protein